MDDLVKAPSVEVARSCLEQARQMIGPARFMWLKARESLQDAEKVRVSLHAQIEELAHRGPFRPQFTTTLLSGILGAVIEGTGADMGNIQAYVRETESLRIRLQRGFQEPFLDFFDSVDPGHAACGTALKSRARHRSRHSEQPHFFRDPPPGSHAGCRHPRRPVHAPRGKIR